MARVALVFPIVFAVLKSLAVPLDDASQNVVVVTKTVWVTPNPIASVSDIPTLIPPSPSTTVVTTVTTEYPASSPSSVAQSTSNLATAGPTTTQSPAPVSTPLILPTTTQITTVFLAPSTVTITAPAETQTVTNTITITAPPSPSPTLTSPPKATAWSAPALMTDMSAFNIKNFAYGQQNMRILVPPGGQLASEGAPGATVADDQEAIAEYEAAASAGYVPPAESTGTVLQVFYPANSINPSNEPQGGADFYAKPLDLAGARSVTLEYSVFFPADFDWVVAGKLPGIYGGHDGCSGGVDASDCFSTRLMWRQGGAGELYLYAPRDKQTAAFCATPPRTLCDSQYGLSVGRGAFYFARGNWTHVRQTVALNTPGKPDGAFALEMNGETVISRSDVFYRDVPKPPPPHGLLDPLLGPLLGSGSVDGVLAARESLEFEGDAALYAFPASFAPPPVGLEAVGAPESEVVVVTSTATVVLPPSTVTSAPTVTRTEYEVVIKSNAPRGAPQPMDLAIESSSAPKPIEFTGLFFSTFFGGHDAKYATPKDQFTWFKDFAMSVNA